MIILEYETMLFASYQMVFEGYFENNIKKQMVSRISDNGGHRLWLQGPLYLFTKEQRTNYIIVIFLCILEFLSIQSK